MVGRGCFLRTVVLVGRTDEASLLIHAGTGRVWAAFVDPRAWEDWLPPGSMTGQVEHFDPRPGGTYRMVLTYRDPRDASGKSTADTDVVEGRFVQVVPDERIEQAVDFVSDDPDVAGTMTMTWSLTPRDGSTVVTFRADDVPPGISAEDHIAGLTASLDNLAAYVA